MRCAICSDRRFDALRYTITDHLAVGAYEMTPESTAEMAALHVGPLFTNPAIVIAAVVDRPDILSYIDDFKRYAFTSAPYRAFGTLAEARRWVDTSGSPIRPPGARG